jgi:hypothetical protein
MDRDKRIQALWETAADMLDFLKHANCVINEISAPIVADMMKPVYHCMILFENMEGKAFSVHFAIHSSTDTDMSDITQDVQHMTY